MATRRDVLFTGLAAAPALAGRAWAAPAGPNPEGPGAGPWAMGRPEDHGLRTSALEAAARQVAAVAGRQGLVVVRNGVLVFERYWANDYQRAEPTWRNVSFSSGKSWGSAMVGIAVRQGKLRVDDPIDRYHPAAYSGFRPGTTLRHLLTMSSGGSLWQKPPSKPPPKLGEPRTSQPGGDYILRTELVGDEAHAPAGYARTIPPGTLFWYSGAASDHVSDVVAGAVGQPTFRYQTENLLRPLGVENFDYQSEGIDPRGNIRIGGSIELSCRDMARLGQLWLNGGRWAGRELVSADYVAQSIRPSALNPDYGFLWWLNTSGRISSAPRSMFNAAGAFGQYSFVIPERRLVVATMGFNGGVQEPRMDGRIWDALAPALLAG
jgi:CubicO group peptidase (beta-lactamase class C family)